MNNLQMKLDNFQRNQNDFQKSFNDSQKKQDDFQNMMLSFMQNYHNSNTASTSRSGALPSQTVTNPREHVNAITTRSDGRRVENWKKKHENSKVFDEPVLPHTPFSDKVECFDPGDDNDEIDAFLAIEVPIHIEGYFDSEGDWILFTMIPVSYTRIPPGIVKEHEDYINRMSLLCSNSSSQSPENFHTIIESLPISTTRIEDSDPNREEIDI
ncbi:hypothetical protein Tco_1137514 [Tanacetum coccineum]